MSSSLLQREAPTLKARSHIEPLNNLIRQYVSFKRINRSSANTMPPDFKTKLKFDPGKLSSSILKKYLFNLLDGTEAETLLSVEPPAQYTKDPDNLTNYRVLRELGLMSVKEWKERLKEHEGDVEHLYLEDDMVAQDSRCYYESWKIIQEEVGNHEKQMSFFRLVAEIVSNLANRSFVEIDHDGEQRTLTEAEQRCNRTASTRKYDDKPIDVQDKDVQDIRDIRDTPDVNRGLSSNTDEGMFDFRSRIENGNQSSESRLIPDQNSASRSFGIPFEPRPTVSTSSPVFYSIRPAEEIQMETCDGNRRNDGGDDDLVSGSDRNDTRYVDNATNEDWLHDMLG